MKLLRDRSLILITAASLCLLFGLSGCEDSDKNQNNNNNNSLSWVNLPNGFRMEIYADNVTNARGMARGAQGTLFVGSSGAGIVHALRDTNNDNIADRRWTIAENLDRPVGLAFRDGDLYVSAVSKILVYRNIENELDSPPPAEIITDQLPTEASHNWRYIAFGPDDKLYVGIGAPCNICESDSIFASIIRMNPDGSNIELFASGIRNTVGFDWHPTTGEMWFTDNGRDQMGDDVPLDELNHAPQAGMHFGYPWCHGGDIPDPDFDARDCSEFTPPVQKLGPHVAALGMLFYTGTMFPAEYKNQIFIAEHGSWNRSTKIGYRVTLVKLSGNQSQGYEVFADGFLNGDDPRARPVDLLQLPDGSLLLSDDFGNTIYRISYE